ELAPGVVVDDGLVHALGQAHVAVLDQPAQRIADGGGDRVLVAAGDGRVDGPDQLVAAGEVDAGAAGIGHRGDSSPWGESRLPPLPRHNWSRKPRTAGPKRSKSTRKASWPWGDSSGRKAASAPPARRPSAICSCCCSGNRMSVATPMASAFSTRIRARALSTSPPWSPQGVPQYSARSNQSMERLMNR